MLTIKQLIAAARLEAACGRGPKHPLECSGDYAARMRRNVGETPDPVAAEEVPAVDTETKDDPTTGGDK